MGGTKEVWIAASALSAVLAAHSQAHAQAVRSGKAGMVRPGVSALRPGAAPVRINVGDPVFSNQRLVTDSTGRIVVMLLDRSTLTLGPDSELNISEYAYDPAERSGNMAIEAAKGFFRFVGGFLSKRRPVRIRTASATIGIRGADVTLQILDGGRRRLIFNSGLEATVTPDGGDTASVSEPGFMIEFTEGVLDSLLIEEVSQDVMDGVMGDLYGPPGERIPVGTISDADFAALRERIAEDADVSIEELERILGFDVEDTIDRVAERLEELGAEAAGTGGFSGGGPGSL